MYFSDVLLIRRAAPDILLKSALKVRLESVVMDEK